MDSKNRSEAEHKMMMMITIIIITIIGRGECPGKEITSKTGKVNVQRGNVQGEMSVGGNIQGEMSYTHAHTRILLYTSLYILVFKSVY